MIIGVGCDIVSVNRFKNKDKSFVEKILSPNEINMYNTKIGKQKSEFLAGRFCAKEAIIKALPKNKELDMTKIDIFYDKEKPKCMLYDYNIFISISHECDYAISYVCISSI